MAQDLHTLRSRFSSAGITLDEYPQGLIHLNITTRAATARLYVQGAHLTHFQPTGAAPVLFMSERSVYLPGKPLRGGVPIVFPWFGPHPTDANKPAHGCARTSEWELQQASRDDENNATLALSLAAGSFALTYTVRVGADLRIELEVRNAGRSPATFEEALHTYLAVGDVRQARIDGLAGRDYLDKTDGARRKTQSGPITITGETDRVYLDTPDTVTVHDPAAARELVITKESSATTVVWNPWIEKSKRMADFGDEEWPGMLCIETANAADNAVTLQPGAVHRMGAGIGVKQ